MMCQTSHRPSQETIDRLDDADRKKRGWTKLMIIHPFIGRDMSVSWCDSRLFPSYHRMMMIQINEWKDQSFRIEWNGVSPKNILVVVVIVSSSVSSYISYITWICIIFIILLYPFLSFSSPCFHSSVATFIIWWSESSFAFCASRVSIREEP